MTSPATSRSRRALETAEGFILLSMCDAALRELDSIGSASQRTGQWYQLRGEALRTGQRHTEALEAFRRADTLQPDNLETLLGIAWCQKRIDQLSDAIETTLRAYRAYPREPVVLYNLACYFSLSGQKVQALSWLGRALRMEPGLRSLIPTETDFDPLRHDPDFQFVVADPREEQQQE